MTSQDLLTQSNGGFASLGWGRMVSWPTPEQTKTIRLCFDKYCFGLSDDGRSDGYIFQSLVSSVPANLLPFLSSKHFTITREKVEFQVNLKPAILKVHGRNGMYLNKEFMPQGSQRILASGDHLKFQRIELFQFIDDREFFTQGIPKEITTRFHIDGYFGKGGQSRVALIHDKITCQKAAMKTIITDRFQNESDQSYSKRIQHLNAEVSALQKLSHPNIIPFIEAFTTGQSAYILMEYAEQGDLLRYMQKRFGGYLPETKARACLYQVTKGVQFIHANNIAHRDLKVDNIFVKHVPLGEKLEPVFMIGDFGYSKSVDQHLLTQLGTQYYLPPEIQDNLGEYTLKADIWSLGCVFFAVLSGSFPFHESYGCSVAQQISQAQFRFTSIKWQTVSNDAKQAIRKMLQRNPEARPSADRLINGARWFRNSEMLNYVDMLFAPDVVQMQ